MNDKPVEPRIVEAVAVASGSAATLGGGKMTDEQVNRAKRIELAMIKVVEDHRARGIVDPLVIREAMLKARAEEAAK